MTRQSPTLKQRQVFKRVMKGEPVSKAMVEVGYSEKTAVNPQQMVRTKGWKELLDSQLPDKLLMKVHKEGLKASKDEEPDYAVRHKYLDTAYKIKAKYQENGIGVAVQINVNSDKETFA